MKGKVIIILIFVFFIGYVSNTKSESITINEKLKQFENEIVIENNNIYERQNAQSDNVFNKIGKVGEKMIDKSVDILFKVIKKVLGE